MIEKPTTSGDYDSSREWEDVSSALIGAQMNLREWQKQNYPLGSHPDAEQQLGLMRAYAPHLQDWLAQYPELASGNEVRVSGHGYVIIKSPASEGIVDLAPSGRWIQGTIGEVLVGFAPTPDFGELSMPDGQVSFTDEIQPSLMVRLERGILLGVEGETIEDAMQRQPAIFQVAAPIIYGATVQTRPAEDPSDWV